MSMHAAREMKGIANSLRGTLVEAERARRSRRLKQPSPRSSAQPRRPFERSSEHRGRCPALVGSTRRRVTGTLLNVYFVGGKVASVRPDDLPFDQLVSTSRAMSRRTRRRSIRCAIN